LDAVGGPNDVPLERGHEELVDPQGVDPVQVGRLLRRDDVAARFRHLLVQEEHVALGE